jgi:hypothetical protein
VNEKMNANNGYKLPGKRTEIPVVVCDLNELLQLMGPKKYFNLLESIRVDSINEGIMGYHALLNGNFKRPGAAA